MTTDSRAARPPAGGGEPSGGALLPGAPAEEAGPWRRHLPLPGTINVRDVGGYPIADPAGPAGPGARRTRWRTLLRADALHRLDDDGRAALAELGLRTVIDLREDYELTRSPDALDPLAVRVERVRFYGAPVPNTEAAAAAGPAAERPRDLAQIYEYIVDARGEAVAAAVRALAAPGALPAIVHCSAGKDRTGIVVAMVLDAVGVAEADVIADYALTGTYLNPETTSALEQVAASSGLRELGLGADVFTSPPELIRATLARVRAAHGSVRGYLTDHGVTAEELDRLAAALVTAA